MNDDDILSDLRLPDISEKLNKCPYIIGVGTASCEKRKEEKEKERAKSRGTQTCRWVKEANVKV